MKKLILKTLSLTFVIGLSGCAPMSYAVRSVAIAHPMKNDQIVEATIDAARDAHFPAASKIDKANGVVEFGGFGGPELGITAQVRIKSETEVEITVKRGSVYVPLGADKQADEFRDKLQERIKEVEQKH